MEPGYWRTEEGARHLGPTAGCLGEATEGGDHYHEALGCQEKGDGRRGAHRPQRAGCGGGWIRSFGDQEKESSQRGFPVFSVSGLVLLLQHIVRTPTCQSLTMLHSCWSTTTAEDFFLGRVAEVKAHCMLRVSLIALSGEKAQNSRLWSTPYFLGLLTCLHRLPWLRIAKLLNHGCIDISARAVAAQVFLTRGDR